MSRAEGVSPAYAAKILRVLRKGGFVKAERGKEVATRWRARPNRLSSPTSSALWAAASSRANSATAIPARPHLHPFRGLLRAFPLARRADSVDQVLAKATLRDLLQNEEEMNSWVRTIPGPGPWPRPLALAPGPRTLPRPPAPAPGYGP